MTEFMRIDPDRIQVAGKFDSAHRHLRASPSSGSVIMAMERTIFDNDPAATTGWGQIVYLSGVKQFSCTRAWGAFYPQMSESTDLQTVGF